MPQAETITWRETTGNKYSKSLHPAMLTSSGYVHQARIRRIGDATKSIFHVVYDREYVIDFLSRTVCRPLFALGRQGVLNLVGEAWDRYYGVLDKNQYSREESA